MNKKENKQKTRQRLSLEKVEYVARDDSTTVLYCGGGSANKT